MSTKASKITGIWLFIQQLVLTENQEYIETLHYWIVVMVRSSHIHLREISQEIPQPSVIRLCLQINLKLHLKLPGANELSTRNQLHLH